jgi:ubiquinone/menaquinone biosynthesis C-methylase UbiE
VPEASDNLTAKIHEANISLHRIEVNYYELFHPEVYSRKEQKRITAALNKADKLITDSHKKALDFGAGKGNLTDKLLSLGYTVTAVDISPEMCEALRKKFKREIVAKRLTVINSPIEDVAFSRGTFDLVACYSVLHHIPDYEGALRRLCSFVKTGGVMYLDHEASPYYWNSEPSMLGELVKAIYLHSNPLINSLYFRVVGFNVPPNVDYGLSDYWYKKEHPLDHSKIQRIFKEEKFGFFERTDYHGEGTWVVNPLSVVYRHVCRADISCWLAKK